MDKRIRLTRLERLETIAQDVKKEFSYDKHAGTWSWYDRGDAFANWHNGFATRLDALLSAVEPYLSASE